MPSGTPPGPERSLEVESRTPEVEGRARDGARFSPPRRANLRSPAPGNQSHVRNSTAALLALALVSCDSAAVDPEYEVLPFTSLYRWEFPDGPWSSAGAAAMDASGTSIVGFSADGTVLALDPRGTVKWRFGRRGEGPGEFGSIGSISVVGDTVFVADPAQQRMVKLSQDGELLGTTRLQLPGFGIPYRLAGGDFAFSAYPAAAAIVPGYELLTLRINSVGVALDTLARVGLETFQISVSHGSQMSFTAHPLPGDPIVRVAPTGELLVRVERRGSADGVSPSIATLEWIDLEGSVTAERHVHFAPVKLTASVRDSLLAGVRSALAPIAEMQNAGVAQARLPEFLPPVTGVLVGGRGEVWLREASIGADTAGWVAVTAESGVRGRLRLPGSSRLLASNGCWILVAQPDSLDVESITLGSVCRESGEGG